jgi:hypothetical protein
MTGFIVLIIGLALGAHLMHVPQNRIGVGVVVMIGLGILLGVTSTKKARPGLAEFYTVAIAVDKRTRVC